MTLPLQPMTTAPRDGSEVLLFATPSLVKTGDLESRTFARWDGAVWVCREWSYNDIAFSGWLDLEALARDSARLEVVYELAKVSNGGTITIELPLSSGSDWDGITCLWDQTRFRAAIDKEAERD